MRGNIYGVWEGICARNGLEGMVWKCERRGDVMVVWHLHGPRYAIDPLDKIGSVLSSLVISHIDTPLDIPSHASLRREVQGRGMLGVD